MSEISFFDPIDAPAGSVPKGGDAGEVLTKVTSDDYDMAWMPSVGGGGGGGATFTENIVVSLSNGKTFGKYVDGDTIVAIGKTANDVIKDACFNTKAPTLSFAPDSIPFGFSGSKTLNSTFSYTINTQGSTPALVKIEKANKNNPDINSNADWNAPILNKTSGFIGNSDSIVQADTITHTRYNLTPIKYRFTVKDSLGGENVLLCTLTPDAYEAPTISNTVISEGLTRYRGDADSTYAPASGSNITITKKSNYVKLKSYRFEKKIDSNPWVMVGSSMTINDNNLGTAFTQSFVSISYSTVAEDRNANTLSFRIVVIDEFNEYNLSLPTPPSTDLQTNLGEKTLNFYHKCGIVFSNNSTITIQDIDNGTNIGDLTSNLLKLQNSNGKVIDPVTAPSSDFTYYVFASTAPNLVSVKNRTDFGIGGSFGLIAPANAPAFTLNGLNKFLATVTYKVYKSSAPGAFTGEKLTFS